MLIRQQQFVTTLWQEVTTSTAFQVKKGDWNACLILSIDNLAKIVILPTILMSTFHFTPGLVFEKIMPGLGLSLLFGLGMFAYLAVRLASTEQRHDVTALPYGISTPVMFVTLFAVMGPVYFASNDALLAYRVGLGAAFVGGLIKLSGVLIGPWLQKVTPPAGLMGTIAGVAVVWITLVPSAIIFGNPLIGLPALFVILLGLIGRYRFPFGLPVGLVAIGLSIVLGLLTGDATLHFEQTGFYGPVPVLGDLWIGLQVLLSKPELLAIVIPIEIYNFIEIIGNVNSAKAAGDTYNMRTCLCVDSLGTCLGAVFGSPFSTTVYIGHPAYKQMEGRTSYALMTGLFLFAASLIGFFALLQHLIPAAGIAPLLVFVGIVMTHYAFRATPAPHGVAIVFALVPHLADLLKKQLDGTLLEVVGQGAMTPTLAARLAANQGVYLQSYELLSQGAIITGLLWGSILAFLIDGQLRQAMFFSFLAFCLSLVGLIHAPQLGLTLSPMTLGYLLLTGLFGLFQLARLKQVESS